MMAESDVASEERGKTASYAISARSEDTHSGDDRTISSDILRHSSLSIQERQDINDIVNQSFASPVVENSSSALKEPSRAGHTSPSPVVTPTRLADGSTPRSEPADYTLSSRGAPFEEQAIDIGFYGSGGLTAWDDRGVRRRSMEAPEAVDVNAARQEAIDRDEARIRDEEGGEDFVDIGFYGAGGLTAWDDRAVRRRSLDAPEMVPPDLEEAAAKDQAKGQSLKPSSTQRTGAASPEPDSIGAYTTPSPPPVSVSSPAREQPLQQAQSVLLPPGSLQQSRNVSQPQDFQQSRDISQPQGPQQSRGLQQPQGLQQVQSPQQPQGPQQAQSPQRPKGPPQLQGPQTPQGTLQPQGSSQAKSPSQHRGPQEPRGLLQAAQRGRPVNVNGQGMMPPNNHNRNATGQMPQRQTAQPDQALSQTQGQTDPNAAPQPPFLDSNQRKYSGGAPVTMAGALPVGSPQVSRTDTVYSADVRPKKESQMIAVTPGKDRKKRNSFFGNLFNGQKKPGKSQNDPNHMVATQNSNIPPPSMMNPQQQQGYMQGLQGPGAIPQQPHNPALQLQKGPPQQYGQNQHQQYGQGQPQPFQGSPTGQPPQQIPRTQQMQSTQSGQQPQTYQGSPMGPPSQQMQRTPQIPSPLSGQQSQPYSGAQPGQTTPFNQPRQYMQSQPPPGSEGQRMPWSPGPTSQLTPGGQRMQSPPAGQFVQSAQNSAQSMSPPGTQSVQPQRSVQPAQSTLGPSQPVSPQGQIDRGQMQSIQPPETESSSAKLYWDEARQAYTPRRPSEVDRPATEESRLSTVSSAAVSREPTSPRQHGLSPNGNRGQRDGPQSSISDDSEYIPPPGPPPGWQGGQGGAQASREPIQQRYSITNPSRSGVDSSNAQSLQQSQARASLDQASDGRGPSGPPQSRYYTNQSQPGVQTRPPQPVQYDAQRGSPSTQQSSTQQDYLTQPQRQAYQQQQPQSYSNQASEGDSSRRFSFASSDQGEIINVVHQQLPPQQQQQRPMQVAMPVREGGPRADGRNSQPQPASASGWRGWGRD